MKANILVVDDEELIRDSLVEALEENGYAAQAAADGEAALGLASAESYDVVVSDIRMPGMDGIELLKKLRELSPETMVVMITAYAELQTAIDALRYGAADYVLKPFKRAEILGKVERIVEHRRLVLEVRNLRRAVEDQEQRGCRGIVGGSPAINVVHDVIERVASLPSNVLIMGESGTGKEVVARAIHSGGSRDSEPFVPINCAAIPEALLESELFGHVKGSFTGATANKEGLLKTAGEGTIFLDEIGEMPPSMQSKLLRAIDNREVQPVGSTRRIPIQARIIAATNRDLKERAKDGGFREDLYFRLAVVEIEVPPLRERREDIPKLIEYFIEKLKPDLGCGTSGVSSEALRLLAGYDWPGNIRELANTIERAMIFCDDDFIGVEHLPPAIRGASPATTDWPDDLRQATSQFEREHVSRVIESCDGNKRKAAKVLGIGVTSLYRKLGLTADSSQ
ncbi:MAG: sigma-54-dependent transcriptional regulator [Planctomycetota bacterium]|jgi:DNA-binding NtrC family response regulator